MDRTERYYAAFEKAMDEQKIYRQIPEYSGICALIGADPLLLDDKIYDELGWRSG